MPGFWIFMYRVSPFTYLMGALMATGVGDTQAQCSAAEFLTFNPPQGLTCGQYTDRFVLQAGGIVTNRNATQACLYCPMLSTDEFLGTVSVSFGDRWRDLGIVWAYVAFNVLATLTVYYLARVPRKGLARDFGLGSRFAETALRLKQRMGEK
jgi:ATP-binding cassette, subfamily G (WHITE), member 2, PDR